MNIDAGTMRPTEHGERQIIRQPLNKLKWKYLVKVRFTSLMTVGKSIWIWETMSGIWMSLYLEITISQLEKFIERLLKKRFVDDLSG